MFPLKSVYSEIKGDKMSKIEKIFHLKFGMGIVEKIRGGYIRSHPKLLKDLKHEDYVVCIEKREFKDMVEGIEELIELVIKLDLNPQTKKKFRMQQLKEVLEELEVD